MIQTPSDKIRLWTGMDENCVIPAIVAVCEHYLRGLGEPNPEDVAQDVIATILEDGYGVNYRPDRGSRWSYVVGTARIRCFKALYDAGRLAKLLRSLNGLDTGIDAEQLTVAAEIRDALEAARSSLTDMELAAFDQVMERAEGTRPAPRRVRHEHVRATRCRKRLRQLLDRHAPDGSSRPPRRRKRPK